MNSLVFFALVLFFHVSGLSAWDWPKLHLPPVLANPKPVNNLVISGVTGRWFQMYTSLIPSTTIEKDGFCITADITSDSVDPTASSVSLTVEVTENKDSATGEAKHIKGTIVNNDFQSDPGEFAITVEGKKVSVWVIGTGELDANGQYPWISLSDSKSENLFILARDVSTFESQYKDAVLKQVKKQGFVWPSNKPVKTFQSETECVYSPLPTISPISETVPITSTTPSQGAASDSSADTTFKPPANTHQNMPPPPADVVATDSTAPKMPVGHVPIQPARM